MEAFFSSTEGCVVTDVYVLAREEVSKNPPETRISTLAVHLLLSQFDTCTNTQLLAGIGDTPVAREDFRLAGNLESATLSTTVSLLDLESGTTFDALVNLAWTAFGPLTRESTSFRYHTPDCKIHTRLQGTMRLAEASGTVSDGTTNFTPEPSLQAQLFTSKSGEMSVGCN